MRITKVGSISFRFAKRPSFPSFFSLFLGCVFPVLFSGVVGAVPAPPQNLRLGGENPPSTLGKSIEWVSRRASTNLSGVSGISSLPNFMIEFHMHNIVAAASNRYIFGTSNSSCLLTPAQELLCGYYNKTGAQIGGTFTNLAGRNDVRVRIQLATGKDQISMETWNGDFTGYTIQFTNHLPSLSAERFKLDGDLELGGSGTNYLNAQMAFFRLRSTSTIVGAAAPTSGVAKLTGDIVNYEFDSNLNDTSGNNKTLSLNIASTSYFNTPSYGVKAGIRMPDGEVGTVGLSLPVESVSSSDENISSVLWEKISGPYGTAISNATSNSASITFRTGGTYTVRLTASSSAGSVGTATRTFGVVAEDRSGLHNIPIDDPGLEFVLGPVSRLGSSPWPWYDTTEKAVADLLGPIIPSNSLGLPTTGPGTVSVPINIEHATVTGSGTSFLTTFNCNKTDWIMVNYPVVGGGTGLRPLVVESCSSNSSMVVSFLHGENVANTNGVMSGASYSRIGESELAFWINGSSNINYYDNVSAYYRLYYRTGNEIYRTYARKLADDYWRYPIDEGRSCTESVRGQCSPPRVWGLSGIIARALDGRPEMWPGIVSLVNDCFRSMEAQYDNASTQQDTRENGYCTLFTVQIAAAHPDSNVRATFLTKARNAAARFWRPKMRPDGSWRVTQYDTSWQGEGAQPWTHAYALYGLASLYLLDGDENVLTDFKKGVQFLWDYGRHVACRGMLYSVFFSQLAGTPAPICTFANGTTGYCHTDPSVCSPGQETGARTLAADIISVFGLAYKITKNTTYRDMGDNLFSAAYGASGGPGSDGGKNEFDTVVTSGTSFLGKQFGMNAGAGRGSTYLALRQPNLLSRAIRQIPIAFNLSTQAGATKVRFTVIYPSGYHVERTCTASPCSVPVDDRHSNSYSLITEYLTAAGGIISSNANQPEPFGIQ